MSSIKSPLVNKYHGIKKLSTADSITIFERHDKDGNGTIEAGELDNLLRDIVKESTKEGNTDDLVKTLKDELLSKYDPNFDGKISLEELLQILPTEENFLGEYRDMLDINAVDFMKIWNHYDENKNGYLDATELKGFLHDLESDTNNPIESEDLDSLVQSMLEMFDKDGSGNIGIQELSQLLPVEENFLSQFHLKKMTNEEFDKIFQHYDTDGNGSIEECELMAFLKDYLSSDGEEVDMAKLEQSKEKMLKARDDNNDGKLSKSELRMILCGK